METWTGKQFARTPSSGGLQWKTSMAKGDIVCTTEGHYFPFCIEAKNHKDINFIHLLTENKKVKVLEFWTQCSRDAGLCNKVPLLFMRFNGLKKNLHFIMITQELELTRKKEPIQFNFEMLIKTPNLELRVIRSDEFFEKVNYKSLKKQIKRWKQR
jgi:hypothetical protein